MAACGSWYADIGHRIPIPVCGKETLRKTHTHTHTHTHLLCVVHALHNAALQPLSLLKEPRHNKGAHAALLALYYLY